MSEQGTDVAQAYRRELAARHEVIAEREPLMFDDESAWGIAALYAVAALELEFEAGGVVNYPVDRQVLIVDYVIEALKGYRAHLLAPDCMVCGAALTTQTTRVGVATWCPTCQRES